MKLFTKIALMLVITALLFTVSACKKEEPTPTPDPTPSGCTEHTYDNACDTDCNTCGAVRETEHTYDNACDTDCNTCGAVRETEHTYEYIHDDIGHGWYYTCGCMTPPNFAQHFDGDGDGKCDEGSCGYVMPKHEHTYDNACDTDCNTCGAVRETEHAYDNACDTDCNTCGATRAAEHTYNGDLDPECNICGQTREITLPEYDGKSTYIAINGNTPFFTPDEITDESYEYYSALDVLGRCGVAIGCLGPETLPTDDRGDIGSVTPSGWHSTPPIYARCHLIAWMISGENANRQNLITGTILLNSTMIPFENLVCDYIKETGNHVMYRATPVFMGDNLVASGIILEAYSVEDEGYGIEFCVYIHNVQTDYIIDYATGDATLTEDGKLNNCDFVVGKSNYKIHLPTCRSASSIKEENRLYMNGTYQEVYDYLVSLGKSPSPCGTCHPERSTRQIYCILPDKRLAPVITKPRRAA